MSETTVEPTAAAAPADDSNDEEAKKAKEEAEKKAKEEAEQKAKEEEERKAKEEEERKAKEEEERKAKEEAENKAKEAELTPEEKAHADAAALMAKLAAMDADSDEEADSNIWRYNLIEEAPMEFLSVNSESEEYSPFVTDTGALYFASDRPGGYGQGDIYRADMLDDGFGPPTLLGTSINSEFGEWNLWVAADESEMIFESSSRPTNISIPGDLYYSHRTDDGWSSAVPIESLNSDGSDLMPRLHPDGETLYYTTAPLGGHARIVGVEWGSLR